MSDQDYNYIKIGELENRSVYVNRISNNLVDLFKLTKEQQIKILNELGVTNIPKYEQDRVNLIIELQGGDK